MYIADCDLKRPGGQTMKMIAACFTQGDSDYLMAGRNGVFYDRKGRDWNATIVRLVDNPISIPQAFFAPYKKFLRLIEEQVQKLAEAKERENEARLKAAAQSGIVPQASGPVDVGKMVGTARRDPFPRRPVRGPQGAPAAPALLGRGLPSGGGRRGEGAARLAVRRPVRIQCRA
jgi:hypothetical protein